MAALTKTDLNFVLTRTPRDIIKLLKDNAGKMFLAGGFIRATIAGERVADIDLFGMDPADCLNWAKGLALDRKGRIHKTENAITVLAPPRAPVQFITRWTFASVSDLIFSFDFTICRAAIWATEKVKDDKGKMLYEFHSMIDNNFYADLAARRLVYTSPVRIEEAGGSLMRAFKFIKKGYNIQAPSIAGLVARTISGIDTAQAVKDAVREGITFEERIAFVTMGLLRQVDPLVVIDGVDFIDEHETVE